jgi:hypothetical protein
MMDSMREKMNDSDFRKALEYGWQLYNENPVWIDINYRMMACYRRLGITDTARMFARNYYHFLDVIYQSGDGTSVKTAFVVDCINDEYHILADLGLKPTSQALVDGPCDRMDVKAGKGTQKELRKIKSVYFNISKPFESLSRMFNKKE